MVISIMRGGDRIIFAYKRPLGNLTYNKKQYQFKWRGLRQRMLSAEPEYKHQEYVYYYTSDNRIHHG